MQRREKVITWIIIVLLIIGATVTFMWLNRPLETANTNDLVRKPAPSVERLLVLVNEERAKAGVDALKIDDRLNKSAQTKADDMLSRNYFGHTGPDGKHGYEYITEYAPSLCENASENITDNATIEDNSSEQAVYSWVHSSKHFEAMLDPKYELTGFGISGTKIVEHFCQVR